MSESKLQLVLDNFKKLRPFQPLDICIDSNDNNAGHGSDSAYSAESNDVETEYELIESSSDDWSFVKPKLMEFLDNSIRQLNSKQAMVLAFVSESLDLSSNGNCGARLLVQGKAGTGKSDMVKMIIVETAVKCGNSSGD